MNHDSVGLTGKEYRAFAYHAVTLRYLAEERWRRGAEASFAAGSTAHKTIEADIDFGSMQDNDISLWMFSMAGTNALLANHEVRKREGTVGQFIEEW